ncbi:MAG: 50S ribosomal protein L22 [Fidelibacterota bacterium]
MESKAISRYIRQSPRKLRQVVDVIRGKDVETALSLLHFSTKRASVPIEKAIRSAISNMLNSEGGSDIEPEDMVIKEIFVDEGPTMRRYRPRAMGRATIIRKRSSHLTVVLSTKNKT